MIKKILKWPKAALFEVRNCLNLNCMSMAINSLTYILIFVIIIFFIFAAYEKNAYLKLKMIIKIFFSVTTGTLSIGTNLAEIVLRWSKF